MELSSAKKEMLIFHSLYFTFHNSTSTLCVFLTIASRNNVKFCCALFRLLSCSVIYCNR